MNGAFSNGNAINIGEVLVAIAGVRSERGGSDGVVGAAGGEVRGGRGAVCTFSARAGAVRDGGHPQETGDRRRRSLRKNVPADRVQQRPVPRGVRADRVRELRGRHRGRRQAGGARAMGHGRPGGLRPPPTAVLPRH